MKFARRVFLCAGIWGLLILTPLWFPLETISRQHPSLVTDPQFFYGFLTVTLAWQFAFLAIGSDPSRFRGVMLPSVLEKFGYVAATAVLFASGRIGVVEVLPAVPDAALGVLFSIAFAKVSKEAA